MSKKENTTLIILVVFFLIVIIGGVSFAYFTANTSGGDSASTIVTKAGTMNIAYDGGANIELNDIFPRAEAWATKNFTVTGNNTTELNMSYSLSLVVDANEFINDSLSYTLTGTNTANNGETVTDTTNNVGIANGTSSTQLGKGTFVGDISNGVHSYVLKIFFLDSGGDQNGEQNKAFAAHVVIASARVDAEETESLMDIQSAGWDGFSSSAYNPMEISSIGDTTTVYSVAYLKENPLTDEFKTPKIMRLSFIMTDYYLTVNYDINLNLLPKSAKNIEIVSSSAMTALDDLNSYVAIKNKTGKNTTSYGPNPTAEDIYDHSSKDILINSITPTCINGKCTITVSISPAGPVSLDTIPSQIVVDKDGNSSLIKYLPIKFTIKSTLNDASPQASKYLMGLADTTQGNGGMKKDYESATTQTSDTQTYRYYGANPNNYVYFNGDNVSYSFLYSNVNFNTATGAPEYGILSNCQKYAGYFENASCVKNTTTNKYYLLVNGYEIGTYPNTSTQNSCESEKSTTFVDSTGITCNEKTEKELWRIIGIFETENELGTKEYRVKIIRNDSIGLYSYDSSISTVDYGDGYNEWSQAAIMKLLNPGYDNNTGINESGETITANNSLYYNKTSGLCYISSKNVTESCNFTSTGLKDDSKNFVDKAKYYTAGWDDSSIRSYKFYDYERGSTTGPAESGLTRSTSWLGYVGLLYVSDYGSASDDNTCVQETLTEYSTISACHTDNWLWSSSSSFYTMTPVTSYSYFNWNISEDGGIGGSNISSRNDIRPVVYLKSSVKLTGGTGSKSDPYTLGI